MTQGQKIQIVSVYLFSWDVLYLKQITIFCITRTYRRFAFALAPCLKVVSNEMDRAKSGINK